jgi:hypothetical protein
MTPAEIVQRVVAAGGTIRRLGDGRASATGELPADLIEAIRGDREGVLDAWEDYERNRWLRPPPEDLILRKKPAQFNASTRKRVDRYVMQQGGDVARWALLRAAAYSKAFPNWSEGECATSACSDVMHWQLARHADPAAVLVILHESVEVMK